MFHTYKTDEQSALPVALEESSDCLKGDNTFYVGDFIPEAASGDRIPPDFHRVPVRTPFLLIALVAAVVSGGVMGLITVLPLDTVSPWLESALGFVSTVGAGLLSIGVNGVLVERSQSHYEYTEDIKIQRKRRWRLRRSHVRKPS